MQTDFYIFFFYNKEYFLISRQYTTSAYFYASYNDTWIINLHGLHKDRCHVHVVLFLWFREGDECFFQLMNKAFFLNIITCNTCWIWEQTTQFWCLISKLKHAKQFYLFFPFDTISSYLIKSHYDSHRFWFVFVFYIIWISFACIQNKS